MQDSPLESGGQLCHHWWAKTEDRRVSWSWAWISRLGQGRLREVWSQVEYVYKNTIHYLNIRCVFIYLFVCLFVHIYIYIDLYTYYILHYYIRIVYHQNMPNNMHFCTHLRYCRLSNVPSERLGLSIGPPKSNPSCNYEPTYYII